MSFWTKLRDGFEAAASVVLNYYYPGSSLLTSHLVSRGAQGYLGTPWGQGLSMISGIYGGATGQLSNYGSAMSALSGGAVAGEAAAGLGAVGEGAGTFAEGAGTLSSAAVPGAGTYAGATGGMVGTGMGAAGGGGDVLSTTQQMMNNGMTAQEAINFTGLSPAAAEQAGLSTGNSGLTWRDVAELSGQPYGGGGVPGGEGSMMNAGASQTGAAQTFSGQTMQGIASGAPATQTLGVNPELNAGNPQYYGGYNSAAAQDAAMKAKLAAGGLGSSSWTSPGTLLSMAQGAYGLYEANKLKQAGSLAQQQADPFGPFRQQYADQMSALSKDPSLIENMPGYQAGLKAIQRSMGAQGYTGTGTMKRALAKYGGDFYDKTMNMYGGFAGAGFNPAAGAQLGLEGTMGGAALAGNAINSLGRGSYLAGNRWPGFGA